MKTVRVEIEGMTPYLMCKFTDSASTNKATRRIVVSDVVPREEAEKVAYRADDGTLYFNAFAILGCLKGAGSNHKMKGSRKSLRFVIPSAVRIKNDTITLLNGDKKEAKDFEVDARPVTIPSTKGRIMRYRPRLDKWGAKFELGVNDKMIAVEQVHILLNEAGESYGIGDFRPEKSGPFGTFRVVRFEEI